jgi:hypothetical protein
VVFRARETGRETAIEFRAFVSKVEDGAVRAERLTGRELSRYKQRQPYAPSFSAGVMDAFWDRPWSKTLRDGVAVANARHLPAVFRTASRLAGETRHPQGCPTACEGDGFRSTSIVAFHVEIDDANEWQATSRRAENALHFRPERRVQRVQPVRQDYALNDEESEANR